MLILTRRVGETVMIGDDVTITVWGQRDRYGRINAAEGVPSTGRSTSASSASSSRRTAANKAADYATV